MKTLYILVFSIVLFSCKKSMTADSPEIPGTTLTDLKNIQYGSNVDSAGINIPLMLDVYFPSGATSNKKYPLVMLVHGGGYIGGDKSGFAKSCEILADSGFIAVSINYRLGWRKGIAACDGDMNSFQQAMYRGLQDGNAALRLLMSKANDFAIDPNWIFIGGASAGGNLALNVNFVRQPVATIFNPINIASLGAINNSGNTLTNTFSIKGICNMWGGIVDSTLITPDTAIPTISFHGRKDKTVPYDFGNYAGCPNYATLAGSMTIHRQLQKAAKASIVHISLDGGHGPDEFSEEFIMSNTACFFKKIMKGQVITSKVLTGVSNSCQ